MTLDIIATDVLVLGAGLAGMRAAWAALESDPNLVVTVVSQRFSPSGSSFANINDKLGMQVCLTDRERETFVREAVSIAPPGYIDPVLVRILAEESEARFRDLEGIGFPFDQDDRGEYFRAMGCFSPVEKRAFIFSGLGAAFEKLKEKFLSLGGHFFEGWLIQDIIKDYSGESSGVCGAVLQKAAGKEKLAIRASSVIVALGGPASLFPRNVSGPGTHGVAHALLERAGAVLVNAAYIQFLWHTIPFFKFWPIHAFLNKSAQIRNPQGDVRSVPEELFELSRERSTHCPIGYGTKDTAIDQLFIENLNPNGEVDVFDSQNGWRTIALMAHAGNGGSKIDENAWTGVDGLYACGESAGGMHGANRIGGAMVTGTQVFGARAGKAAAKRAGESAPMDETLFSRFATRIIETQMENEKERREILPWLHRGMQAFGIMGGRPGLDHFMHACLEKSASARDWRLKLALEAAIIIGMGK